MPLAGGHKVGDRVVSTADLKVLGIGPGVYGTVVGPCDDASLSDAADRVKVDWDTSP